MVIFKFGGASVKDSKAILNVVNILENYQSESNLLVVVSAMDKITRSLEAIAEEKWLGNEIVKPINQVIEFHDQIVKQLSLNVPAYEELKLALYASINEETPKTKAQLSDQLMSYGELFSSYILAAAINKYLFCRWIDSRDFIITDNHFSSANPIWEAMIKEITKFPISPGIYVTQGFIGRSPSGYTTTLGKEGSDFSAAIFANLLDAKSVTVWKDVPGIMNADPKKMLTQKVFDELSYQEISEMTFYGAKVIHPRTLAPLAEKGIPLYVKPFKEPTYMGTIIHEKPSAKVTVPTYIFLPDQVLVTIRTRDNHFMDEGKLMQVFTFLHEEHIKINLMQTSALTFSFCFQYDNSKLERLQTKLSHLFVFTYNEGLELVTIKNYTEHAIQQLPTYSEEFVVQRSRSVFQRVYKN